MATSPSPSNRPSSSAASTGFSGPGGLLPWIAPACLALLIFAVPLEWGGRSDAGKALVKALAVLAALAVILTVKERRRCTVLEIPVAAILIATVAASVTSVSFSKSLGELELVLAYALAFWSALQLPDRFRSWLVSVAIASGALLSLVGIYWWWGSGDASSLVSSTFYNKNPFAGYLVLVIPLVLGRLAASLRREETALYGAIALLLLGALVLTRSRGALLALGIAACALVLLMWWRGGRRSALRLALPCLAVGLAIAWLPSLLSFAGAAGASQFPQILHTDPGRLAYWQSAWEMGWDRPVLGWGPGTFADIHPQYQTDVRYYSRSTHNQYLQAWAEGGFLLGGAFLALAVLALVRLAMAAGRESRGDGFLAASVFSAALAFLVHLSIDVDWGFPADPALFMVLLGVASAGAREGRAGAPAPGGRQRARSGSPGTLAPIVPYGRALAVALVGFGVLVGMRTASGELLERAGDLQLGGDLRGAEEYLRTSFRLDPGSGRVAGALAAWHLQTARQAAEPAGGREALASGSARGLVAYHLSRARAEASASVRLEPHDPLIRRLRGTVLAASAVPDLRFRKEAEREFLTAIRLDPFNRPQLYRALAAFYRQDGRTEEAGRTLRKGIALYPAEKVSAIIGNYGGTSKEVVESLRNPKHRIRQSELEATLGLRREVALLYVELGQVLAEKGKLRESVIQAERALEVEPYLAPAHRELGMLFLAQGRLGQARSHFLRAAGLDPRDGASLLQLARTEMALGLDKQAAANLRRLLALYPGHREAGLLLGLLQGGGPRSEGRPAARASGPFGGVQ